MRRHRILVLTHDPVEPVTGGGALRTLELARALKNMGQEVVLLAPGRPVRMEGVASVSVSEPTKARSSLLSVLKFNFRLLVRLRPLLGGAGIVCTHNTISALFLPVLKRFYGFRFFLDMTDLHSEYGVLEPGGSLSRLCGPLLRRYERWIARSADSLTVGTRAMQRELVDAGVDPGRVRVVYDGADPDAFYEAKNGDAADWVIHLGAVDRQHGVELLVQAIPRVLAARPSTRFLLVGDGRQLPLVRRRLQRAGIAGVCEFTGRFPRAQACAQLKRAGVGLIMRPDTLANRVVTTLKLFDYWASGTAVVAPALEGIQEVAADGKNALLFTPGDGADLAAKILRLLEDPALRGRLSAQGLRTVDRFRMTGAGRLLARAAMPADAG